MPLSKEELEDSKTALVLADETLLYPVLHNLPAEVTQLNITMGSPLKNTVLFAFVESIFKGKLNEGVHQFYWSPSSISSGTYFIHVSNGKHSQFIKTVYLK